MVTIADMQQDLKEAEEAVEKAEVLEKLLKNREFRKVILEDFLVNDAVRSLVVSTDHDLSEAARADALGMAQAAGYLKRWLVAQEQFGRQAKNKVASIKHEIELMRAEEQDSPATELED